LVIDYSLFLFFGGRIEAAGSLTHIFTATYKLEKVNV